MTKQNQENITFFFLLKLMYITKSLKQRKKNLAIYGRLKISPWLYCNSLHE